MTMITTATANEVKRGDATLVADITKARGLNNGKGYSQAYVYEVLRETRSNAAITAIHAEVCAMRTPTKKQRRRA